MDRIDFPLTGNSLIMAIVILIHVFLAFIAVGGSTMAVYSEWRGRRKEDEDFVTLARRVSKFLSDMMKINGVLGVAIVVLSIGLWGTFSRLLYSALFWPFVIEGLFFLILMTFSILYNNSWDKASKNTHLFYGIMTALAAIVSAFLINSIWAFMMIPGNWIVSQNRWDAFLNPIVFESFLHMLIPCLLNASLAIFLWTYWKSRSGLDFEYYLKINKTFAKIAGVLIFLQPLSGLGFLLKIKSATQNLTAPNPWGQIANGLSTPFFQSMIGLALLAVICAILFWIFGYQKGRKFLIGVAVFVSIAFVFGAFTRERARKPYLVWGAMYMNQKMMNELVEINAATDPTQTLAINGERLLKDWECRSCHTLQGTGGNTGPALLELDSKYNEENLALYLKNPPADMPPFTGSEADLQTLVKYLLHSSEHKVE